LQKTNRHIAKSLFGYAPESPELYPYLTGGEYLQMLADLRDVDLAKQLDNLVDDFDLEDVVDDLIIRYSHGMRQKISFAAALIGEPKNLILDEALNGFDPVSLFNAKNYLQELATRGHTILISSHVLELLEGWCEEFIILNEGQLLATYTADEIKDIKEKTQKTLNEHFVSLIRKR
jgi:ABC-2 type transport system ATP-binding protein